MKRFVFSLAAAFALATAAHAQWVQQTFQLRPGWNAIFLAVHPEPAECDTLFAGVPVESVWDYHRAVDLPQFVQDPALLVPNAAGWLTWFPPAHPLASQSSVFTLRDGRGYLVHIASNATAITAWTVTGRPSLRRIQWHAGGVNFVGFRVGAQGPTFQSLFAGDNALANQPVYALNSAGAWQVLTNSNARPGSNQAYWVNCRLPSQRAGTIQVDAGSRLGITFVGSVSEQTLRIRNTSSGARTIAVRVLPSAAPPAGQPPLAGLVPLEFWRANVATTNFAWAPFTNTLSFTNLGANAELTVRLGVRRAGVSAQPGAQFQSILEVTDDLGTRWLIPVMADAGTEATALASGRKSASAEHAGLWVGDVLLNAVSQPAHPSAPNVARPAGGEFSFRIILHVDESGATRLLQHVFLARKPPTYVEDPDNPPYTRIAEPARTIVATDESIIPGLVGAGEIIGRRLSSAAFGFRQPVLLAGAFGGTNTGTITLGYDDPLNPFKHRYHPDHDNLDERFETKLPEGRESFNVVRAVTLEFGAVDPLGVHPPGWGNTELGGTYRETISGLHRQPIQISGAFRLVRASRTAQLNQ